MDGASAMEEQAHNLLVTLRKSSIAIDAKLAAFNNLKSSIKHLRVPEASQAAILECIKFAIGSQASPTLVSSGFSTLGHLIKRLSLQEQTAILTSQTKSLLPTLLDRLGDARESHRNAASQVISDLWPYNHAEVERTIRENALVGHNARAKEMAMEWVVKMNKVSGLPFRTFVPHLVANLEDSDGCVRESAKMAVIDLFRNAPEHAKTDLKREMASHDVRKTIVSQIVAQLGLRSSVDLDLAASTASAPAVQEYARPEPSMSESVMSEHQPAPQEAAAMDPLYISTQRELEDYFRNMQPHFEGKETEHNWMARDKSVFNIRRLMKGNAPTEFHVAFTVGLKSLLDGILKVANSLRTTMSTNGCLLVREAAQILGPALDPMVEILIQSFIKMSAATKQIAANNGNTTVITILSHVSYSARLMQHIWLSFQDKNVQTRTFASGWLVTLLKKHAQHKALVEHSGGLEVVEKCIKKGLADANPKVREGARGAYWTFTQMWPSYAEGIMSTLDAKSKSLLEKDPRNPNAGSKPLAASVGPAATTKPSVPSRQSVRDVIAAQKRAAQAARQLERPASAQSVFSPAPRAQPTASRPTAARSATVRPPSAMASAAREEASAAPPARNPGTGLMGAPVRRPRRPEIARPATADPYAASRRAQVKPATPTLSPATSPQKTATGRTAVPRTATKTPGKTPVPTGSSARLKPKPDAAPARNSPRTRPTGAGGLMSSPGKDDNFTLVVPFTRPPEDNDAHVPLQRQRADTAAVIDSSAVSFGDEDGFTMVIPNLQALPSRSNEIVNAATGSPTTPKRSPARNLVQSGRLSSIPRFHSPSLHPPERTDSQPKDPGSQPPKEAVQVYEDPTGTEEPAALGDAKPVLEELPLNERAPGSSGDGSSDLTQSTRSNEQNVPNMDAFRSPRGHHKTTSTGSIITSNSDSGIQASTEALRSRRLLMSGIERIRAKTLDAHGFRRVQDIVKSTQDIWGPEGQKYGELLLALLDYLESSNESLKVTGSKAQNLKAQVLATVRAMLVLHRKEAEPYYSRALCSVLAARRQFGQTSHITSDIEKTADEIVRAGHPADNLEAVLDLIDSLTTPQSPTSTSSAEHDGDAAHVTHANNARTITMSLSVLGQLLTAAQERKVPISPHQTQRLGQLAVHFLSDTDPDVRKADLEFCLALHERLGGENGEGFWKAVSGAKEMHLNLITYYLARRGRNKPAA